ncbi:hypothetical protein D3C87_377780 [compost metagenome]
MTQDLEESVQTLNTVEKLWSRYLRQPFFDFENEYTSIGSENGLVASGKWTSDEILTEFFENLLYKELNLIP